jgi:hypothetical protein
MVSQVTLETVTSEYSNQLYGAGPQSALSVYHYAGMKIHNTQLKLLSSNFNQFKKALKNFLQLHSFYTLAAYLNYNRN